MRRNISRITLDVMILVAFVILVPEPAYPQAPLPSNGQVGSGSVKFRFGLEYWMRASWRGNFDFDKSEDDGLLFAWQRIKPMLSIQSSRFEFTVQGQDSRSYGVPLMNPNGSLTAPTSKSQLDFIKAYVKIRQLAGFSLKVGREQGDGVEVGISKRLLSSTNYGTVLKSFDLVALNWENENHSFMGFVSSPVDNRPSQLNKRRRGELFWGLQSDTKTGKNFHRGYLVGKSITRDVLSSETGVKGDGVTYALGFQESGPILLPGIFWDIDAIFEWGHRSTDTLRAWAFFINGTHTFSKNHALWAGYHEASGDGKRGDGMTHLYDFFYASGFNEYGYMGFSAGRNIRHVKVGGNSKITGPVSVYWTYHDKYLADRSDLWYAIFTPNIFRSGAQSSHLGQELDASLNFRFPFAKYATISLGYLGFFPGAYLKATGPHASAHQFTIDVFGQF